LGGVCGGWGVFACPACLPDTPNTKGVGSLPAFAAPDINVCLVCPLRLFFARLVVLSWLVLAPFPHALRGWGRKHFHRPCSPSVGYFWHNLFIYRGLWCCKRGQHPHPCPLWVYASGTHRFCGLPYAALLCSSGCLTVACACAFSPCPAGLGAQALSPSALTVSGVLFRPSVNRSWLP